MQTQKIVSFLANISCSQNVPLKKVDREYVECISCERVFQLKHAWPHCRNKFIHSFLPRGSCYNSSATAIVMAYY